MIETSNPEIDVNELMERVRREAAKIGPREPRRPQSNATTRGAVLPLISDPVVPPALGLSQPIDLSKDRTEENLKKARGIFDLSARIPKIFRSLFRRQGRLNRGLVDTVTALTKSNARLIKRMHELMIATEQHHRWMNQISRQRQTEAAWFRAAGGLLTAVPALQQVATRLEQKLGDLETSNTGQLEAWNLGQQHLQKQIVGLQEDQGHFGTHLRDLQSASEQQNTQIVSARDHLHELRAVLDQAGENFRSLQERMLPLTEELRKRADQESEHLRNLQGEADQTVAVMEELRKRADREGEHLRNLQSESAGHAQRLNEITHLHQLFARLEERQINDALYLKGELSQQRSLLSRGIKIPKAAKSASRETGAKADEIATGRFDNFYLSFENRFRGRRAEIKERSRFYLPFLEGAQAGKPGRPILDVGCGRGEWLELLQESELEASGVDLNSAMVAQCQQRRLAVIEADALAHLRSLPDSSLGAVSGFHIIEHLPWELLFDLATETFRVLQPGGLAIFESPNCKNLTVGASNFNIDPTHRNPVFPETAQFMLESTGFAKVDIQYLTPAVNQPFSRSDDGKLLNDLLYGAQDFAVIGHKSPAP